MLFSLRGAVASLLALTSLVKAQDVPIPLDCYDDGVQIIALVGTNVPNGTESYGLTVTFVQHVMNAFPLSGNFSVNYSRNHTVNQTHDLFIPEVNNGVRALHEVLVNYTEACPKTPIVLHGYSEGAVVVMNTLCGSDSPFPYPFYGPIPSSYANHIISVTLYGDESRTANQSYDLGGCKSSGPHLARLNPGVKECAPFAPSIQSYCFANDADCCATANTSAPYPYGINPHYLYPAGFDQDATNFVKSRWSKFMNITTVPSTTLSSTISPVSTTTTTSSTTTTTSSTTTSSTTSTTPTSTKKTTTTTKTTSTKNTLSIEPSCSTSIDPCLLSFANHPTTASRFCSGIYAGKTTSSPFPTVCATGYPSRYSSACNCLILSTSSSSSSAAASPTTTPAAVINAIGFGAGLSG